jgi:hypothetical protein
MIYGRLAKILLPPGVSAVLLAGVVWWVTPERLLESAAVLDWHRLVPAAVAMVLALYLWDALCLPAVYRDEGGRISYWQALHLRGLTYWAGAFNYELGQATLAWGMARLQGATIARMLARSILLAYHDVVVLLAAGSFGSLLTDDARVARLRPFLLIALAVCLVLGFLVWMMPDRLRAWIRRGNKNSILDGWSLRRSLQLLPLRFVYFSILLIYGAVALAICRLPVDWKVVFSTVPLVLLADGLPSFAGLGTRETMLHVLLSPDEPNPTLIAMSLFWTIGMIVGRLLLATGHLWLQRSGYGVSLFDRKNLPAEIAQGERSMHV